MLEGPPDRQRILADAARMAAIAGGDTRAFEILMQAETARLVSLSESLLSNSAEAEEVVQDAFIRLWQQASDWQPKARVATWLYRVTYRLSIDRLRRRRPSVPVADVEDGLASDGPSPEEELWMNQRARLIDAALRGLPPRQRAAIVLAHGEGLSQSEAAAVLELSQEAYESLLARARRQLRKLVAAAQTGDTGSGLDDR